MGSVKKLFFERNYEEQNSDLRFAIDCNTILFGDILELCHNNPEKLSSEQIIGQIVEMIEKRT